MKVCLELNNILLIYKTLLYISMLIFKDTKGHVHACVNMC